MKFSTTTFGAALLVLGGLALTGCLPSGQSAVDEEKETYFLAGKGRSSQMDFKGAIESFEKALEVNPRSASAHFELALLYETREIDPAAAIYHYQQFLRLRPGAENADVLVKPHILHCKQEIARNVSLGAVTERQQHEFEQLAEDNRRLMEEVQQWRSRLATNSPQPQVVTRIVQTPPASPSTPISVPPPAASLGGSSRSPASATSSGSTPPVHVLTATASSASKTHTVKSGETPTTIARKYSVKVEALMAANPRLDSRHMRVGQVLTVPPTY